jgi:uncharacterized membrane protein YozB (DUF420 family)
MRGFLSNSFLISDISLVVSWILLILALIGYFQARKKNFEKHEALMPWAALLNWIPVLAVMVPMMSRIISGKYQLTSGAYGPLPYFHAALGIATQVLITYTVFRMKWAEDFPPKKPLWLMRISLIMWVLTLLGGTFLYLAAYVLVG